MKKIALIVLCLLLVPQMAEAAKKKHVDNSSMIRKESEAGQGTMFREKKAEKKAAAPALPDKDCQYLAAYQPPANSDVEYKPGVDAKGRPVMEADISPTAIQLPEKIGFDVTVDVAKYMGLAVPTGTLTEAKIGTITVEKGRTLFNGKPLEGDAEAALRTLCAPAKPKPSPAPK